MDTTDLVELLRRLARQWADDNRASPELEAILDAFDAGGEALLDLAALQPDRRQRERLRSRLARLGPIGVHYMPHAGTELAQVQLSPRARAASRARHRTRASVADDDTRASVADDDPRASDADAQLRAPGCSVLRTSSVLSSLVSAHSARIPLRACEGGEVIWTERARRVLELLVVEVSDEYFPAWVDAVYSACEYLAGWESLLDVIAKVLKQPVTWDGTKGWKGWPQYMRGYSGEEGRTGPMEYLTRSTMLEGRVFDVKKNTSGGQTSAIFDTAEKQSWEETVTKHPRLQTVRDSFERQLDADVWETWLPSCKWSVVGDEACLVGCSPYHHEWITENYLPVLEQGASSAGLTLTMRPPGDS